MFSKKLTILYPILHYPPVIGGLEQWSQNIAERQPENLRIIVVTGRVNGAPCFERENNVTIYRTSLFSLRDLSHSSILYIASAVPFIVFRSFLLARGVDIFHCHGFVSALMGCFISMLTRRPFIGTEQSVIWNNSISKLASRVIYRRARLCIASSRAVYEGFRKLGVKNIEIIPNGVDLEKFIQKDKCATCKMSDTRLACPSGRQVRHKESVILLSVGRLEKVKGHKHLIEAFSIFKKEVKNAKLILVGDGSERGNLERQAEKLAVKDSIQFIGAVRHDDIGHYYHKADVFLMPSLSEGFGITAVEAMASGIPVIATSVGGLAELVEDKKTGLLVPPANASSLAEALRFILDNAKTADLLAKEGVKKATGYSWNSIASRVGSMYKIIASQRILLVSSIFPPDIGGPSYYAERLRTELKVKGYEAGVISGRRACSFRKVFSALRNFEICYALSSSPKILLPAFLAAKLRGKKLALRVGGDFLWERAVERGRTDAPLRLFYEAYKKSKKEKIIFRILGVLFRRCDFVIFTSSFLKELYIRYYGLNGRRIHIIENSYPEVDRRERSFPEDLVLLCAGRLIKLKNIDFLLHAFKEVKRLSKLKITLKIIGDGPEARVLSSVIYDLGLKDDVLMRGALPPDALIREIQQSWLVVVPSLSEVTPNLVLESCAAGTPVIVTRENGLPENILANIMTFNPKDKKELIFTILFLSDSKKWQDYRNVIMNMDTTRSFQDVASDHVNLFQI